MSGALTYTEQQLSAIETRGSALLVSAAAGSGKTKVLVERLLRYISGDAEENDITDFLIITYTRAAADELRSKIQEEIAARLALEPDNRHLRRQAALVYEAQIGTIHGFCTDILRENAHLAGLSPYFRVADESEAVILREKALEDLLERRYETVTEAPGFALLVDTMSAGRDDKKLTEIVLDAHAKLQSHASPENWIKEQVKALEDDTARDASETVWGRFLMDDAAKKAAYWLGVMRGLYGEASAHPEFLGAYGDSLLATLDSLEAFIAALGRGWDEARACAVIDFPRPKNVKEFDDLKERRKRCKEAMKKAVSVFECASADLLEDMAAVRPAVTALLSLVLEFDEAYAAEKRKRSLADFSDLEHLAARILTDTESGAPTETALAVSRRYREIMVDEYQDVSRVQERIFNAVSRDGQNIFMVGDVKQSIYRFRLADPAIFLEKYKAYRDAAEAGPDEPRRVLLSTNFRSKAGILSAVNFVFKNVMSEDFGEMAYTEREFLYPGRTDEEPPGPAVELDVLDMSGADGEKDGEEDGEEPEKTEVEAAFVAARIEELLRSGMAVPDGQGGTRTIGCGDFAILLRSVKDKAPVYERALAERNIPASLPGGEGFFTALEVSVALSLLGVIDNPRQDIPLIAVLRSPIYNFTPDELAVIRASDRNADFYGALVRAAETDAKCRSFLYELSSFRLVAPDMPADRFLWHVYNRTDMLAVMGALKGGRERRSNLMALVGLAARYEAGGYRGLFGFMTLVRKLIENGEEPFGAAATAGSETAAAGAVRIMSIHKSKGLEFPIVIIADTAKRFNKRDASAPLLIHAGLGVGAKRTDLERRIEYPTLARLAVARRLNQETMSEELRVLYVAMTRAKERLVVVSTFADAGKELSKLEKEAAARSEAELRFAPQVLENARSMAELILLPALTRPEAGCLRQGPVTLSPDDGYPWDIRRAAITGTPALSRKKVQPEPPRVRAREEDIMALRENLGYSYPYLDAASIPSKLTATGLKGRFADYEAAEEAATPEYAMAGASTPGANMENTRSRYAPANRPAFITQRTSLTAAERGTALHLTMQYIDYGRCLTPDGVRSEVARLKAANFLSEKQADAVDAEKITAFFKGPLGRRVMEAEKLYREFKFSLLVPAEDYSYGSAPGDEILLQGVVDCCFEEGGALHVIDFKTDNVTEETLEEKKRLYAPQLNAYGHAMERITGLPAASRIIWFFALDKAVQIE